MRWIVFWFWLIFSSSIPGVAQTGAVIDLDGYSVELPVGWKAPTDYPTLYTMNDRLQPVVILYETGLEGLLVSPTQVNDVLNGLDVLGLDIALAELIEVAYGFEVSLDEIEGTGLGVVEGVRWSSNEDETIVRDIYLIPLTQGGYLFADLSIDAEVFFADSQAHLLHSEQLFTSAGASLAGTSNCEISASADISVPVRAWPDINRVMLMRLPAEQPITVVARWVDSQGNTWYQLDETQLNPTVTADGFWVAQSDVNELGQCDTVQLTELNSVMTNPTNPNLSETLPEGGTWIMEYARTVRFLCEGQPEEIWDIQELLPSFRVYVPIIVTENTLRMPEGTLDRVGEGRYSGRIGLYGLRANYDLFVIATNSMNGEIVVEVEDSDCILRIDITLTRR